jgi:hypothetical protein
MARVLVALVALVVAWGSSRTLQAQQSGSVDFTQVTRPVVQVTDSTTIDYLLFELFVEPLVPPTRLQVIDVTQNGFGPDDVIIAYPSVEAFLIPELIPDSVQAIMSGWVPEVEYRMDSGNMSADALASLIGSEPDTTRRAESAILYDLVRAVDRSYQDLPVAMLFQRDSTGFTFQLWDYNRPAMRYSPRPDFVADSAVSSVLAMLREVGYVPGENVVRTGLSLESQDNSVVTVDRALSGTMRLPDERTRMLAARIVLLGSYDFDRSGALDQAREIDAPPCEVWNVLEEAFPDFLEQFGFGGADAPYLGNIVFNIAQNVREPAYRRGSACLRGDEPPETDPSEVPEPAVGNDLTERAERFVGLEAAGEILERAGQFSTGSAAWSQAVRSILMARFDEDGSGLLDRGSEIRSVPCDVWQAMAATHPDFPYGLGFLVGDVYVGDHIGVAADQREEVLARSSGCVRSMANTVAMGDVAPPDQSGPTIPAELREFLDLLTASRIVRSAVELEPGSARWATMVRSVLLRNYDRDGSGTLDQRDELREVPCPVWTTIEATYEGPRSGTRLGAQSLYFADQIGIASEQRLYAAVRIQRCLR